jgi:hypothetical protein
MSASTPAQIAAPLRERTHDEQLAELTEIAPDWTWGAVYKTELRFGVHAPARRAECPERGLYALVHWSEVSKVWSVSVTDERAGGLRGNGWQGDLRGSWAAAMRQVVP